MIPWYGWFIIIYTQNLLHRFVMWNFIIRFQSYASNHSFLLNIFIFIVLVWTIVDHLKLFFLSPLTFKGKKTKTKKKQWCPRVKKSLREFDNKNLSSPNMCASIESINIALVMALSGHCVCIEQCWYLWLNTTCSILGNLYVSMHDSRTWYGYFLKAIVFSWLPIQRQMDRLW